MPRPPRVLRISRAPHRAEGDFILLHISQDGPSDLDLKLIATEGTTPYVGAVKHDRLDKLRGKRYDGPDEEWQRILSFILLRKAVKGQDAAGIQGLEVFASVTSNEMTITLRKHVGGITQRIGTIPLWKDEAQEIELFDWAGLAAQAAVEAEDEKGSVDARLQSQNEATKRLSQQLEDITRAKEEHESALLEKFVELLNSKKLKIRDQQRLLGSVKIDPTKAADIQRAREAGRPSKASSSGAKKRKAGVYDAPSSEQRSDLDKMDVDVAGADDINADERTSSEPYISEASDQETADDESAEGQTPPPSAPSSTKGQLLEPHDEKRNHQAARESPPPPRQLPFARNSAVTAKPGKDPAVVAEGPEKSGNDGGEPSDGETDDDEL